MIIINMTYNLVIADKLEIVSKIMSFSDVRVRKEMREEFRDIVKESLNKKQILNEEDKIILFNLYKKIKKEFEEIELSGQQKK